MTVVVIGAGSIGKRHFSNLETLGVKARLVGWRAFRPADLEGASAVVIATATQVRAEIVTLCAARELPFYVEKPLAYRADDLAHMMTIAAPLAERCLVGFMMRYHPAFRDLAQMDLSGVYGFSLEIGHDVRQWRQNWSFAGSYAARPEGGGVLLDLCHELDMAHCLFPEARLRSVDALGHAHFAGVDFASRIALAGGGAQGTVAMDYLSPVSLRRIALRGTGGTVDLDFIGGTLVVDSGQGAQARDWTFERNDMFLDAMRDFLALVDGCATSGIDHLPRLDRVGTSCALIAQAWEARRISGMITGDYP